MTSQSKKEDSGTCTHCANCGCDLHIMQPEQRVHLPMSCWCGINSVVYPDHCGPPEVCVSDGKEAVFCIDSQATLDWINRPEKEVPISTLDVWYEKIRHKCISFGNDLENAGCQFGSARCSFDAIIRAQTEHSVRHRVSVRLHDSFDESACQLLRTVFVCGLGVVLFRGHRYSVDNLVRNDESFGKNPITTTLRYTLADGTLVFAGERTVIHWTPEWNSVQEICKQENPPGLSTHV